MAVVAEPKVPTLVLEPGQEWAIEPFACEAQFQTEAELEAMGGKKKRGRLGRLTYNFRMADTINGNRRMYPKEVCDVAMKDLERRVAKNQVFGNLDHPPMWDPESAVVKLSEACVRVAECGMMDMDVKVVLDILDNPHGRQLVSVLESGGNPGVSQRGIASWRDMTPEERKRFGVPEGDYVRVAEFLRLITYDVVSEPGFADAQGAKVSEHKGTVMFKTKEEIKAGSTPEALAALVAEAAGAAQTANQAVTDRAVAAAVEAAKPGIMAEAQKTAQVRIDEAKAVADQAKAALATVKPVMVKLGIVNEQITDAQAAAQIATITAEKVALEAKVKEGQEKIEALTKQVAAFETRSKIADGLRKVHETYKGHKLSATILKEVAKRNIADPAKALEAAAEIVALVDSVTGETSPPAKPAAESTDGSVILASLGLVQPAADPRGRMNENLNPAARGVAELLAAGGSSF